MALRLAWKLFRSCEAEFLRDGEHLGFVLLHFVEADLVNLVRCEVGCGGALDEELVVLFAVRERRDAGIGAAGGNVGDLEEAGEARVRRQNFLGERVEHLGLDARLLGSGDGCRELFERERER